MKTLNCDVCRKEIVAPVVDRNYFHIADWDVCEPCKEDLDRVARFTLRAKKPFNYDWFDDLTISILREGKAKGRIEIKAKR